MLLTLVLLPRMISWHVCIDATLPEAVADREEGG